MVHVGSELGFVDGGLLVFKGTKTTDYHEEMNAKVFEQWFQKVLQLLPDKVVIVMDNASVIPQLQGRKNSNIIEK